MPQMSETGQTRATGQTSETGQTGRTRDTIVRVIRAPMRELATAWISNGRTVSVLERQTSLVAARHAADRRRYIAERARALAGVAAEHQRLALLEQQLCCEIEARLEQLGLELQLKCADCLEAESGNARRRLSLQMLLAMLLAGEARTFLDSYRSEAEVEVTVERLQALEQHANSLAEAIETIAPEAARAA
jgi:hypothetical protein